MWLMLGHTCILELVSLLDRPDVDDPEEVVLILAIE